MAKLKGKSPKDAKPTRPRIAVFGPAGVGKTWTSLDWPDCYYIDAEGGANLPHYVEKLDKVGAMYLGPEDGADDFDVVLGEIQSLMTTKHDRKTVIVDSFSKVFQVEMQAEVDRLTRLGKKIEFSVEKKPAIQKSKQLVAKLGRLDMNAILIMHQRPLWQNGEQIGFTFDGWDKLDYEFNLVLQIVKQGGSRKARVVKSRFEQFSDGELIDWSYQAFADRFGANVLEANSESITTATQEQVASLVALIEATNFDAAKLAKWKDAAGVSDWLEMETGAIAKCIDHLKNKLPAVA